ncbi:MAG: hypothetical protein US31_C0019G0008 [Berkelbacteria bacterium GW2011_GWA1_36_9]|uniref:Uncharacterized protein n=1 Tax=Berkelbacteria bacterium GW2011_GWA1_36_9 TaxID=1618331 RepID=A0A0G0IN10_9BACT|nr:MAG: hypothetical protein US31_C0019G0008 [Berkelbacteria bacterium GW2011_GWA1_36_9]
MNNWSVDTKYLKKYPEKYKIWRLEQLINFGLGKEKIKQKDLENYWQTVKDGIDPYKRRYLEYILWKKEYSLPDNLTFWNLSTKIQK